jgi:hypothetical protein
MTIIETYISKETSQYGVIVTYISNVTSEYGHNCNVHL